MPNNFSRELADALLEKLSTDDHFRDVFEKNPRAALAQLGHHTPKEDEGKLGSDPVMCLSRSSSGKLASKKDISEARSILLDRLSGSPFHFDVVL